MTPRAKHVLAEIKRQGGTFDDMSRFFSPVRRDLTRLFIDGEPIGAADFSMVASALRPSVSTDEARRNALRGRASATRT
ncbi:hypothetical protein BMI86_08020 [Thioclava sp. DLFJ5-1]|uniref:hypothetical protein n=1 Tax=Thioclava sp. DLFJ5-1 TaxID=1915314 RepID=UPI00099791DA|nr:hypothetical protein [Thioclava sp. DLFJ5-1]OOY20479.1 hypothetical protein BMI86_08020 [Thioclava sp. DLFJ5-1]